MTDVPQIPAVSDLAENRAALDPGLVKFDVQERQFAIEKGFGYWSGGRCEESVAETPPAF